MSHPAGAEQPRFYYFRQRVGEAERSEVSYDEALHSLLSTYIDNHITRDMLTTVGVIPYRFGEVFVEYH